MKLDELLDKIELETANDHIFRRSLVAKGYKLTEILPQLEIEGTKLSDVLSDIKHIKEQVREQFVNSTLSHLQLQKEVEDSFNVLVIANKFRLSAARVSNSLHTLGHINLDEAICLWLGLFYEQSPCWEGLWQMYVDYRMEGKNPPLDLPEIINVVFNNPEGLDNEEILIYYEQHLADTPITTAKELPQLQRDIPRVIAGILAVELNRQTPGRAATQLNATITSVHNNLRRGYNTLLYEYLKGIYAII